MSAWEMEGEVDVLGVLGKLLEGANGEADAFLAYGVVADAYLAVADLISAARDYYIDYCVDEANDSFDCSDFGYNTGCSKKQHEAAKRLRAAIAATATLGGSR